MCGIAGVLFHRATADAPRSGQPAPRWCDTLKSALAHRGPDGEGVFVDDGVALVHTRLALVDLTTGQQPLCTPDGRYALVVNGEVYNHHSLRETLRSRGAVFRTRSDSEVLLWALVLDGARGLDAVEGEYAFCLWDRRERCALLGRDTLGVKPLLLAEHAGALWFASEVKALLAALPARRVLDTEAVVEALVAPALSGAEQTPFRGISSLAAGTVLALQQDQTRTVRRDHFTFCTGATAAEPSELAAALTTATHERLAADVEVGAFLSGGVDSSALVALGLDAARPARRCYTIRFDAHRDAQPVRAVAGSIVLADDAPFVEALALRWPIALTRVHASRVDLLGELETLAKSQDRMVAWEQELTQRFLARAAARELKAVLVGDAADETHFGYAFALAPDASRSPRALLARFGFAARRALLRPELRPIADALESRYRVLTEQAGCPYGAEARQNRLATASLLLQRWLPRLLHNGDLHTMAFGLEARVPFADRRVLARAAKVSVDDAFTPFQGVPEKAFLRRAVSPWLPPEIIARAKSALPRDDGMGATWKRALRDKLAQPDARERLGQLLHLPAVEALFSTRDEPGDETRACLFSVLACEAFLRHHLV